MSKLVNINVTTGLNQEPTLKGHIIKIHAVIPDAVKDFFPSSGVNISKIILDYYDIADKKFKPAGLWERSTSNNTLTDVTIYFHNDASAEQKDDAEYCTQWIEKNLFRINVIASGVTAEEIANLPCSFKLDKNFAYTFDEGCLAQKSMPYITELEATCETPKGFIDFILKTKALELAIKYNDEALITEYYTKFVNRDNSKVTKTCGCYGRIAG